MLELKPSDWRSYRDRLGPLAETLRDCLPNALTISPAKTGTTWLFTILREHPDFYLPKEKEVRFFCEKWRVRNLDWYAEQFAPGRGKIKVDISPTYSVLPRGAIRAIHELNPAMKLIFFMRDPVSRAWSHAKHMCVYGEGNFAGASEPVPDVGAERWVSNFIHDWPLAHGTYASCLARWLEFFPRHQILVGFYEDIATAPARLLEQVCHFLGTTPRDWPEARLAERVYKGSPEAATEEHLAQLRFVWQRRTQETVAFLRTKFGLQVPREWSNTLSAPALDGPYPETETYLGKRISYDGLSFRTGDGIRAPLLGQLKAMLESPRAEAGAEAEEAALERNLDVILTPYARNFAAHSA